MGSSVVRGSWILALVASSASLALAQKTPDVRLDVGDPPGASESTRVALVSSGTGVFVTYQDARNGSSRYLTEVHFNRSLDGGLTWLSPDVLLETPGAEVWGGVPAIATESSSVYVAWSASGGSADEAGVYVNRSLDAGSTWFPAAVRIDENLGAPVIATQGSNVYVAWGEDSSAGGGVSSGIYLNRSLDRGGTWLPDAVYVSQGVPRVNIPSLDLVATSSALHAVFARDGGGGGAIQIFYNRSEDGGLTWLPASIRIDHAPSAYLFAFDLDACGSNVYVVLWDGRNGPGGDVYFNRSLDGGATWLAADVRLNTGNAPGAGSPDECRVAASGTAVYVVWEEWRNGDFDVFFNRSLDAGTTWLSTDVRLDVGDPPAASTSAAPRIALSADDVYVTWWDNRNGGSDVYFNRSLDQGSTWLPTDVRIDTGDMPGASDSYNPQIAVSGSSAYVAWYDGRDGEFDIYFNLAGGYQTYEEGTPGSGGIVPAIAGSGNASIGGTASVDVANGLGGAVCAVVYSFGGPATIASKYGTLLLQPPWSSVAVTLGGASGAPGAGSASISAMVPNDLALLGLRLNFQAGVFDSGAMNGVALSNGLELWVL